MEDPRSRKKSGNPIFALNDLPPELLLLVLESLNSQGLKSSRLVCKDWELIVRPIFASKHLRRSIFWVTTSSLNELDDLSRKFGPYMKTVYIASTCFNRSGFFRMLKKYLHDRRTTFTRKKYDPHAGSKVSESAKILDVKRSHLANYFRRSRWQYDSARFATVRFFWHYIRSIASQNWLRIFGQDVSKLATVLRRQQHCEIKLVSLRIDICKLYPNSSVYGKPAPDHAFERALYDSGDRLDVNAEYCTHLEQVIAEINKRRKLGQPS